MLREKTLDSKYVYKGKIINVRLDTVLLPDGRTSAREVVEYTGAVVVVAVTREKEVVMVRQYRYPVGRELIEIPAGKIECGENPETTARRELLEEAGCEARSWTYLGRFYSTPGFTSEIMHLFFAQDLIFQRQSPDEDEFVEVVRIPFEEALAMVLRGEICDAKSICGLLWTSRVLNW
ncbi:MAG: NUDIX hydrolase [Firmicutes bacterium]|nr:NUDIX hydrolase [Bacillota bacterium]